MGITVILATHCITCDEDGDLTESGQHPECIPCTDPKGHVEGFMGFCRHCNADILIEDDED